MKIAVDTSVLLDVLAGDATFGPGSREALRRAYDSGSLLASDIVWSEVRAHFDSDGAFATAMESLGVQYLPLVEEASRLAGVHWRRYHRGRSRSRLSAGDRKRVIADFLIGAHAQVQADALLARDRGFFRSYFSELRLIQP
jgi:predicted nucleic acid-binding protein